MFPAHRTYTGKHAKYSYLTKHSPIYNKIENSDLRVVLIRYDGYLDPENARYLVQGEHGTFS